MQKAEIFRGTINIPPYRQHATGFTNYRVERCPGRRRTILFNDKSTTSIVAPDLTFLWKDYRSFHVLVETPEGLKTFCAPNVRVWTGDMCISESTLSRIENDFAMSREVSLSQIFWGTTFYRAGWWYDWKVCNLKREQVEFHYTFRLLDAIMADVRRQENEKS